MSADGRDGDSLHAAWGWAWVAENKSGVAIANNMHHGEAADWPATSVVESNTFGFGGPPGPAEAASKTCVTCATRRPVVESLR